MSLLDRARATPEDLRLLAVLADHLQEAADPRGLLIARSLAGAPAQAIERLARALRPGILGPDLHRVLTRDSAWRHGFLHRARLRRAPDDVLERALASPELRTVRILQRGFASLRAYRAVVGSALLAGVQDLEIPARLLDHRAAVSSHPRCIRLDALGTHEGVDHLALHHRETLEHLVIGARIRPRELDELASLLDLDVLEVRGRATDLLPRFAALDLGELVVDGLAFVHGVDGPVLRQYGWRPEGAALTDLLELAPVATAIQLVHIGDPSRADEVLGPLADAVRRRVSDRPVSIHLRDHLPHGTRAASAGSQGTE